MLRRQYVVGVGAVVFAGCSSTGSSATASDTETASLTETDGDSPASPVVQHYQALDRNDFEAANAAIHSNSPRGELSDEAIERARVSDYSIDSIETSRADPDAPQVAVTVTATNTETGETQTLDLRIEVQRDDGVWKMYEIV